MSDPEDGSVGFNPPSGFAFEPEFLGHPPRTIPDELDQGPYAKRQRAAIVGLATAGVLCLALSRAPGLEVLARYVLPLGHLGWIGLAALGLAAAAFVNHSRRGGPYRYVRDGMPLPALILELRKEVSAIVNGMPSTYAIHAAGALRHPENGDIVTRWLKSDDFSASAKDHFEAPFRVGDYVTAVYLPGRFDKSLRLYAYLDLNPRLSLRRGAADGESPLKVALLVAGVALIFVVLFANLYAFGRYQPLDFDYWRARVPMALGGLLLGGGMLAAIYLGHRGEQAKAAARAKTAQAEGRAVEAAAPFLGTGAYRWVVGALLVAGAPLLGALTALCWCFMANAWLDTSAPRAVPAKVEGMTETTHLFIFREYEIKFSLVGSGKQHEQLATPEELGAFTSDEAVARIREGRLGWPWVETVVPLRPELLGDPGGSGEGSSGRPGSQ